MKQVIRRGLTEIIVDEVPDPASIGFRGGTKVPGT